MRGVGCFFLFATGQSPLAVSVPLRGVGCFETGSLHHRPARFPSPCGVWVVSMPLDVLNYYAPFPSPCGVWVVSAIKWERYNYRIKCRQRSFPSPCGVWVVSNMAIAYGTEATSFRPLAGCGLFRQSCTFFLVQQEKELSTLLFYCIILADVYQ